MFYLLFESQMASDRWKQILISLSIWYTGYICAVIRRPTCVGVNQAGRSRETVKAFILFPWTRAKRRPWRPSSKTVTFNCHQQYLIVSGEIAGMLIEDFGQRFNRSLTGCTWNVPACGVCKFLIQNSFRVIKSILITRMCKWPTHTRTHRKKRHPFVFSPSHILPSYFLIRSSPSSSSPPHPPRLETTSSPCMHGCTT